MPRVPSARWCVIVLAALACGPRLTAAERPPNVVLILADDLGWRDLGCYGSTFFKTPHVDRLAAGGLRFTDYYAACPVCSPTRASLLTGKYPQRFDLTDWLPGRPDRPDQMLKQPALRQELPLEEVTIAEALKANGYATGLIGKWHLGGPGFEPQKQGFDANVGGEHVGTTRSYFAPFRNKQGQMPGLEAAPDGEYLTDRLTAEAEKFIDANKDRPFFLYLPHYAPHTPLVAKKELVAKYPGQPAHGRQSHPVYAAMVESLDESVGRLVKKLDDLKLSDNTILIFTSDNGGLATLEGMPFAPTINAPLREGKGYLYEGGVRVPLVVKWPGVVKPGTVADQPACSIDLFPTLAEAAGVRRGPPTDLDGVSLLAVFRGAAVAERPLFWHYPHYANQGSKPGGAVRLGNDKLIEFYEDGRHELFDVRKDPSESRNLAAEKPDVVDRLASRLAEWRKQVGAKMPTANPEYVPNPPAKDGTITLPARTARVHGVQLRYEPLPHKDTLGFWTVKDDYATFAFTAEKPGTYAVEVLQGCGKGSGGAEVALEFAEPKGAAGGVGTLTFTVKDTGGFQAFEARDVGTVTLPKPGRYVLAVRPRTKPGPAVMDLRQVVLRPKG
ncbi:MAG: sulfatase-like hydrolase/transferase [Gemmataceae bacterium]|nr:sulfatase-like hydrolase/transferase [Gemmataceae bacterium]